MVEVRFYDSELAGEWDAFVRNSKTPLFFFERSFMEYHSDRFADGSLVVYEDGAIIGLIPASRHNGTLVSHGGLTFGGIIVEARARSRVAGLVLSSALKFLAEQNIGQLRYKAIPWYFRILPSEEDLYFVVNQAKGVLVRRDMSSAIDLSFRPRLSKGRKALLSKANQAGLQVEQSDDWMGFHILLEDVLLKHGAKPAHTASELSYLSSKHPSNIKLLVATKDRELLAGAVIFDFGHVVHTQYLAVSEKGKSVGALDFLIENCIVSASASARHFSFGISTENEGRHLNLGLLNQKESFGARSVILDTYEVTTHDFQS